MGWGCRSLQKLMLSLRQVHWQLSPFPSWSGETTTSIGVLFGWFAYKIEGPGLDGVYSIYQGHLFFQQATYMTTSRTAQETRSLVSATFPLIPCVSGERVFGHAYLKPIVCGSRSHWAGSLSWAPGV